MFRRLFWFALGVGASFRFLRALRRTADRWSPQSRGREVAGRLKQLPADVRAAAVEGRHAMRQREAALRSELRPRR